MSKLLKVFLDKFEPVRTEDEATLAIYPADKSIPPMYFRRMKQKEVVYFDDLETSEWRDGATIDVTGTQDEYNSLVDWWYGNATDEYKQALLEAFKSDVERGFDIKTSVSKAIMWLKTRPKSGRKGMLGRFTYEWIKKGTAIVRKRA